MKAIKLNCKTGGFKFGATVEVGDNKNQIDAEAAEGLVKDGLAVEVKEIVASSGASDEIIANLEVKVAELEGYVEEAINLQKGRVPAGYKKA